MVSEPPRHTTSTNEPVILDMKAQEGPATEQDSVASQDENRDRDIPGDTPAADERGDAPVETPGAPLHVAPAPEKTAQSSTTPLLLAGILGGLIALAGAASMQYAGYLAPLSAGGSSADGATDTLAAEVAELKRSIAALPQATTGYDDTALQQRVTALETGASSIARTSSAEADSRIAALTSTIDDLKASLAKTEQAQAETTTEITKRLEETESKIAEPSADREIARAVAAASLKSAVDRGGPFLAELDTLAGITPDDPSIAALKPFAATGVVSRADLARRFPEAANAVLEVVHQPDGDESLTTRLLSSAMSLVKVRPVGNVAGSDPDAVLARVEEKLENGDLKGAALEWDTLPDAAKTAGADFRKLLDDRLKVEDLVAQAMARPPSATGNQG